MSYLEKVDRYLDSLKVGKSALVDSWFMMSSPSPILAVVVAYLILIRIGPRIMKNRAPLQMNRLIAYYNAFQVFLAVMICVKVFNLNLFRDGIIYAGCRYPSNTQNIMEKVLMKEKPSIDRKAPIFPPSMARPKAEPTTRTKSRAVASNTIDLLDLGWWYFFAKFTELLDTVFFVLRKKNKQITFLHVYHHVIMALYSWSYLKFAAGGEGAVLALLNSIVHVVMYTYYLLSGLGPRFQKYLWWKKYVTKMQLIQFVLMLAYCANTHFSPRCQYASGFTYFICSNIIIFLFLFLNFYTKSYKKKDIEREIQDEYAKSRNGVKTNGFYKNGVAKDVKDLLGPEINEVENVSHEVNYACGDYIKDEDMFITRRTAKAAYGAEFNLDSLIKK